MSIPISNDTLPRVSKHAIWHPGSGLVVSSFNRPLPDAIADRAKASKTCDWHLPRLLGDADIYLAFYPCRFPPSDFFAALALNPDELEGRIVPLKHDQGFMLAEETMDAWIDIEDALVSIIGTLMGTHEQKQFFPLIMWPQWPEHTGYRDWHASKADAFKCV
ncbi:hypothetical protein BDZ94DRAFT_237515 [Collybia nuda]|uniref:Uncharacterized protein n=1 Tax=Collybia nuda TaxID=64659 RepID=A0A9P5XX63_9AGAR|nr:hypothetical protein BDZ94DRAFT_237515 [Collybia nuda]